ERRACAGVLRVRPTRRGARRRAARSGRAPAELARRSADAERHVLLQGARERRRIHRQDRPRGLVTMSTTRFSGTLLAMVLASCLAGLALAAGTGKIQGKVVGTDTGEPLGFADVLLIPADTTLRKIGGMTNAD